MTGPIDPHREWLQEWAAARDSYNASECNDDAAFDLHTQLGLMIGTTPAQSLDGICAQIEMILDEAQGCDAFIFPAHRGVLELVLQALRAMVTPAGP